MTRAIEKQERDYIVIYENQEGKIDVVIGLGSTKNYDATLTEIQRAYGSENIIIQNYGLKLNHREFNEIASKIKGRHRLEVCGELEKMAGHISEKASDIIDILGGAAIELK